MRDRMRHIFNFIIIVTVIITTYSLLKQFFKIDNNYIKLLKHDIKENKSNDVQQLKLEILKTMLKCKNVDYDFERIQHGDYWILRNYIQATHGQLNCHETITYTTHGDYTFLENMPVLIERWHAPVSIALYAPGYDFNMTLNSIRFMFSCLPSSQLIRKYTTIHIYFHKNHMPKYIPQTREQLFNADYDCNFSAPYLNVNLSKMYKSKHNLLYPINVGRNIARKASLSHLVLASDIELYPNPGFVDDFLNMIVRNLSIFQGHKPRIFPLAVFEIKKNQSLPKTKTELQAMLKNNTAIPFHKNLCNECHAVPDLTSWISANETKNLDVFTVGKRMGEQKYWEPFYVGTNAEPTFDERISWEGQKNKIIQGFVLCLLDYEFHVLNNGFLVHTPGIKRMSSLKPRAKHIAATNKMIRNTIAPELMTLFGRREGCFW